MNTGNGNVIQVIGCRPLKAQQMWLQTTGVYAMWPLAFDLPPFNGKNAVVILMVQGGIS